MNSITRRSQLYAGGMGASDSAIAIAANAIRGITSGAGAIAMDQIRGVTFRSQVSPDINLTAGQATGRDPTPSGMGDLFMRLTKPSIYVETSLGTIRLAPWGEPTMNLYPVFIVGTIVGIGALAGIFFRGLKK